MGVRKELLEEEEGINAGIEGVIVGNIKHEKKSVSKRVKPMSKESRRG